MLQDTLSAVALWLRVGWLPWSCDLTSRVRVAQVGERVSCDGIPNTDGGQYQWRCTKVEVEVAAAPVSQRHAGAAAVGGTRGHSWRHAAAVLGDANKAHTAVVV